jgi:hypothetical protein
MGGCHFCPELNLVHIFFEGIFRGEEKSTHNHEERGDSKSKIDNLQKEEPP